jgi:hypothetical protein
MLVQRDLARKPAGREPAPVQSEGQEHLQDGQQARTEYPPCVHDHCRLIGSVAYASTSGAWANTATPSCASTLRWPMAGCARGNLGYRGE